VPGGWSRGLLLRSYLDGNLATYSSPAAQLPTGPTLCLGAAGRARGCPVLPSGGGGRQPAADAPVLHGHEPERGRLRVTGGRARHRPRPSWSAPTGGVRTRAVENDPLLFCRQVSRSITESSYRRARLRPVLGARHSGDCGPARATGCAGSGARRPPGRPARRFPAGSGRRGRARRRPEGPGGLGSAGAAGPPTTRSCRAFWSASAGPASHCSHRPARLPHHHVTDRSPAIACCHRAFLASDRDPSPRPDVSGCTEAGQDGQMHHRPVRRVVQVGRPGPDDEPAGRRTDGTSCLGRHQPRRGGAAGSNFAGGGSLHRRRGDS